VLPLPPPPPPLLPPVVGVAITLPDGVVVVPVNTPPAGVLVACWLTRAA